MRGPRLSAADGFTLVELLASLVVLALLSLLLLQGLGSRNLAWERFDRDTERAETVEAAQIVLTDRIAHIWPQTSYDFHPSGPDFYGWTDNMEFLAAPRQAQGAGPLHRYKLSLETSGDLILESRSDLALDWHHWADRQVLIHGVQAMELAYYGTLKPSSGQGWRSDWGQQPVLPALIRIRLAFPPEDRRRWPDLIVRPLSDVDTECRWLPGPGGCNAR